MRARSSSRRGDLVIVESERGAALGTVARATAGVAAAQLARTATEGVAQGGRARPRARKRSIFKSERDAQRLCLTRIRDRRMSMKLVQVDYLFDGSKAIFYFCAEGRVDFRELVRDLAQALHTRIEMKQIGARDETKLIGGVGPCGRELCCSTWLREFQAVSVKMAKEQGLSLNPSKLSGMCGRLKCCLRYEYETYLELRRGLPRVGARVTSFEGRRRGRPSERTAANGDRAAGRGRRGGGGHLGRPRREACRVTRRPARPAASTSPPRSTT